MPSPKLRQLSRVPPCPCADAVLVLGPLLITLGYRPDSEGEYCWYYDTPELLAEHDPFMDLFERLWEETRYGFTPVWDGCCHSDLEYPDALQSVLAPVNEAFLAGGPFALDAALQSVGEAVGMRAMANRPRPENVRRVERGDPLVTCLTPADAWAGSLSWGYLMYGVADADSYFHGQGEPYAVWR